MLLIISYANTRSVDSVCDNINHRMELDEYYTSRPILSCVHLADELSIHKPTLSYV